MNIKGLLLLKNSGLPIPENTIVFNDLKEIPESNLCIYGNEKRWAMRGFDDRITITDNPYKIKDFRSHGFSKNELKDRFDYINKDMDAQNIPKSNRIYLICKVFYNEDVRFSGHALREENKIFVDVLNGNRPSKRDWNPDISFNIDLIDNKPYLSSLIEESYKNYISRICRDITTFNEKCYLDFTLLKEGYFFYHDLSLL